MAQQTQWTFARDNLLRTCYGETGVMDKWIWGKLATGKLPTCYGLVVYVAELLATKRQNCQLVADFMGKPV